MATLAVTNTFSAGTTIVASEMNTNFDDIEAFVNTTPGVVQNSLVDAEGDLIIGTAADTVGRLAVGTGCVLRICSTPPRCRTSPAPERRLGASSA